MKAHGITTEHPEGTRFNSSKVNLKASDVRKVGTELLERKLQKTLSKSKS